MTPKTCGDCAHWTQALPGAGVCNCRAAHLWLNPTPDDYEACPHFQKREEDK